MKQAGKELDFIEISRLNSSLELPEVTVLRSTEAVTEVYGKLHDSRYSRSAPIPVLEGDESLVIIKPSLKDIQYGDIKISKIESLNNEVIIRYREIENWEYAEKKQSEPVLIIKIYQTPKSVRLKYLKL